MKLADLIPPVAEAFLKDKITIGHALLIAKLFRQTIALQRFGWFSSRPPALKPL